MRSDQGRPAHVLRNVSGKEAVEPAASMRDWAACVARGGNDRTDPEGEVLMDLKLDDGLRTLIESGKEKGYLTYTQVNDYLPDDAVNPEKLDQLLMHLEEQGIELIDESEAEEREAGAAPPREGAAEEVDPELRDFDITAVIDEEGDGRRIDDPVRMYLTQMGSIPLLSRNEEIQLAKKI